MWWKQMAKRCLDHWMKNMHKKKQVKQRPTCVGQMTESEHRQKAGLVEWNGMQWLVPTKNSLRKKTVRHCQGHGHPMFINAHGEQRLVCLVLSHRWATVENSKKKKKLMHAMIETCQNTQSITACCVSGCIATDWYSGHFRTGPWSSSRRWPGLIFFYII